MTQKPEQNMNIAVDIVIFTVKDNVLKVILIQMKKKPFAGMWAFPGGLIRQNESLEDAAKRGLQEKTGVKNVYLEQLYTFGSPKRDPNGRVISAAYFAIINSQDVKLKTTGKYSNIGWFDVKKLPDLAYDHNELAKYALQRLCWKLEYTNVVYSLLSRYFTLSEVQKVYEIILGRFLDRRNFQRKIRSLNLIQRTKKQQLGRHRPAVLYEFRERKPAIVKFI